MLLGTAAAGGLAAAFVYYGELRELDFWSLSTLDEISVAHTFVFALAGMQIVAVLAVPWLNRRDRATMLLGLWQLATWIFAVAHNWSISGRMLVPAAPATGMLLARRMNWATPPSGALHDRRGAARSDFACRGGPFRPAPRESPGR